MQASTLTLNSMLGRTTGTADLSNKLSIDINSLGALKLQAKHDDKAALKGVAQQFEAMFLQMMLRNMRAAMPESELSNSSEIKTFTGMLDDQFAQNIATKRGIGFADLIVRQMNRENLLAPGQVPKEAAGQQPIHKPLPEALGAKLSAASRAARFAGEMLDQAKPAADKLGVAPHVLVAQAALETGWGKRTIVDDQGNDSFNVFGIKAGKDWQGRVAEVTTSEYVNGKLEKRVERFRAYDSQQAAFDDYAKLIGGKERYREALNQGTDVAGFGAALQKGGYATDPLYAQKLARVANHQVLRQAAIAAYQQWA